MTPRYCRWNTAPWADVRSGGYGAVALDFLTDVVAPALQSLGNGIDKLKSSDDLIHVFMVPGAVDLRRATLEAFCLSMQSIWERQLRSYLAACAAELSLTPEYAASLRSRSWPTVLALFKKLRGHPIEEFEAYRDLDLLHRIGNVCRHGEGDSLDKLAASNPELFFSATRIDFPPLGGVVEMGPSAETLNITPEVLKKFAVAIADFWSERDYLYKEGINGKQPHLEEELRIERVTRANRRQMRQLQPWFDMAR